MVTRLVALMPRALSLVVFVVALFFARVASAYTPPPLQGAVTDTASRLSAEDDRVLEARLKAYRDRTSNEIVVFVVGSLNGESIDDVKYGAFNTWKIGKAGKDNGVLLVIAPNDRKMAIETGKGIGDKLTDVESGRILRNRVGPLLKQERIRAAIEAGLDAIEAALDGRPEPPLASATASAAAPAMDFSHWIDRAKVLTPKELNALEGEASLDPRHWTSLSVVIYRHIADRSANDPRVLARVVVTVYADEHFVSVSAPWSEEDVSAADRDLSAVLTPTAKVDGALLAGFVPVLERAVERAEATEAAKQEAQRKKDAQALADAVAREDRERARKTNLDPTAVVVIIGIAVLLVVVIVRSRRRGGGSSVATDSAYGSSTWENVSSSSASSSDSSSTTSSGSSGSDYSGGGGSSGGGGASDSY